MKGSFKYFLLLLVFIILVVTFTLSKLFLGYEEKGSFELKRVYSDIIFTNAIINNKSASIKINNEKKYLHIDIPKLSNEIDFDIDLINVGNKDVSIKNFSFSNIVSNDKDNNVEIITSLKEGDKISGGETRKLHVLVKNQNEDDQEIYYNFNINYIFEEDNL